MTVSELPGEAIFPPLSSSSLRSFEDLSETSATDAFIWSWTVTLATEVALDELNEFQRGSVKTGLHSCILLLKSAA